MRGVTDRRRRVRLPEPIRPGRIALLIVLLCTAAVGGCGSLADLAALNGRLQEAGYEGIQLNHNEANGVDVLTVQALTPTEPATEQDATRIVQIVWETYPQRVDEVRVILNGRPMLTASREAMTERFGQRDPALDKDGGGTLILLIGLLIFVGMALLAVLVIVLLVRRSQRSRRLPDPPYPPGHYYGGPYQQHPPGAPYQQFSPQPPHDAAPPAAADGDDKGPEHAR